MKLSLVLLLAIGFLLSFHTTVFACEFDNVRFTKDFAGGKLDACTKNSATQYSLLIKPENRPINPSPWYAFKVSANEQSDIRIHIEFEQAFPRYLPKISQDGKAWQDIDFSVKEGKLVFNLKVDNEPVWIAGQEIITNTFYHKWIAELASSSSAKQFVLGKSTQGLAMHGLIHQQPNQNEWLVLIGRQHPPELTGALAMLSFVETVLNESDLAYQFRNRFNILIVPIVNPDGVHHGHWRHNVNGIDLNRDWFDLSQVETRQIHDRIQSIVKAGGKMVFSLDFHSTQQDIFYTVPSDYSIAPATFSETFIERIDKSTISNFTVRPSPGVSPGRGVFKQYFADTYNVHSITYEMGDNTQRNLIKHVAQQSAIEIMQLMLATPADSFHYQPATVESSNP